MRQNPAEVDEHQALAEFWEKIDLVVYLALIGIATPQITTMMGQVWENGGIARTLITAFEQTVGISHANLVFSCLGAWVGLVTLLWFDEMKRIQAALLSIATVIGLAVFKSQGLIFPINPIQNADVLGGGFVLAFIIGGGLKIRTHEPPWEFRRATSLLFWFVTGLTTVAFFERHLMYQNPLAGLAGPELQAQMQQSAAEASFAIAGNGIFVNLAASTAFVGATYLFTSYEAETNVVWIGVQRAGKTFGNSSLYLAAREQADEANIKLNPSEPLSKLHSSMMTATDGWGDHQYLGPTGKGEYHRHSFKTRAGQLFKKYINIDALDYAGEYVNDKLVKRIKAHAPKSTLSVEYLIYKYEEFRGLPEPAEMAEGLSSEEMYNIIAKQIIHSDKLAIVIDSGSLVPQVPYGEDDYSAQQDLDEYINTYVQILRHLDESVLAEKEIVLVATKADYLYHLYRNTNTHLQFFSWVNFHLFESEEGREKLGPLLDQAQVDQVYPVYYELDHEASLEEGEPVPDRPIEAHGNNQLLNRLKEEV